MLLVIFYYDFVPLYHAPSEFVKFVEFVVIIPVASCRYVRVNGGMGDMLFVGIVFLGLNHLRSVLSASLE